MTRRSTLEEIQNLFLAQAAAWQVLDFLPPIHARDRRPVPSTSYFDISSGSIDALAVQRAFHIGGKYTAHE